MPKTSKNYSKTILITIVRAINFLIKSKFITGEAIFIDGGERLKRGIINGI